MHNYYIFIIVIYCNIYLFVSYYGYLYFQLDFVIYKIGGLHHGSSNNKGELPTSWDYDVTQRSHLVSNDH